MLSIITPSYNSRRFIEGCIKNVIGQKCSDYEHIIVDGVSTDGTVNIIKKYASQYPHIRWISEKDKGQSDAMNKGINMAKGEILGILNVDDYYETNVLNRVVDRFKSLPEPSFLVGNCNVWTAENEFRNINKPSKLRLKDLMLGWSVNQIPTNPSAYFYHKSLHELIGLYDVCEHYVLDVDFILRAVQKASVVYVDEIWGNWRLFDHTKTHQDKINQQAGIRYERVLRKYRNNLSKTSLFQVKVVRYWYRTLKPRLFRKMGRFFSYK